MTQVNLGTANEFIARHIGPRAGDEQAMLNSLGFDSLEALSASVIPESIKGTSVLGMDDGLSEADALAMIKSIAGQNQLFKTYIGQGYYNCHTPSPILRNLLENARRYGAGDVRLVVREEAEWALIQVCDSGPGVPPEQQQRIFEPFYRLPGASEREGGVGLGLALVKSIAERHGGTVRCTNRPEGGACFEIRLPLKGA